MCLDQASEHLFCSDGAQAPSNCFLSPCRRGGGRKLEFPKIAQNHDCGGSMVSSGSPEHKGSLFLKSDTK